MPGSPDVPHPLDTLRPYCGLRISKPVATPDGHLDSCIVLTAELATLSRKDNRRETRSGVRGANDITTVADHIQHTSRLLRRPRNASSKQTGRGPATHDALARIVRSLADIDKKKIHLYIERFELRF